MRLHKPRSGTMIMKPADGNRRKFKPEYKRNEIKYTPRYIAPGTAAKKGSRCLPFNAEGHWAGNTELSRFNMHDGRPQQPNNNHAYNCQQTDDGKSPAEAQNRLYFQ